MKNLFAILLVTMIAFSCKSKVQNTNTGATYKDVDVAGAKAMISDNKDLVIIDVRTPAETAGGIIPNAIEIDYRAEGFMDKVKILKKDTPYLIYCKSGGRSSSAADEMISAGFKDVTNLVGGYTAWSAEQSN